MGNVEFHEDKTTPIIEYDKEKFEVRPPLDESFMEAAQKAVKLLCADEHVLPGNWSTCMILHKDDGNHLLQFSFKEVGPWCLGNTPLRPLNNHYFNPPKCENQAAYFTTVLGCDKERLRSCVGYNDDYMFYLELAWDCKFGYLTFPSKQAYNRRLDRCGKATIRILFLAKIRNKTIRGNGRDALKLVAKCVWAWRHNQAWERGFY